MKSRFFLIMSIILLFALLLSSCGFPGAGSEANIDPESMAQTIVAQTMMPMSMAETMVAQTMAAAQGDGGEADAGDGSEGEQADPITATPTQTATQTPTPTITLTQTLAVPMVSVSVDTNCRVGPGKIYDWLGALIVGETAEVIARSADGQYWVIRNPDQPGGTCWLWGNYATVEGPIGNLPVWDPPPTPTPSRDWSGTWTVWVQADSSGDYYVDGTMTINVTGDNFTGSLTILAEAVDINGYLNEDRTVASGTWTSPYDSGPFVFYWGDDGSLFTGNYDTDLGWCGRRDGGAIPDPCYQP